MDERDEWGFWIPAGVGMTELYLNQPRRQACPYAGSGAP